MVQATSKNRSTMLNFQDFSLSLSLSLPFGNVFLPWRMPCVNANACTWRDAIGHLSSSTSDERRPRVSFSRPDAPMTNRSGLFPDYLPFSPFLLFHLLLALYQKSTSHDDQVARTNFFFLFFFLLLVERSKHIVPLEPLSLAGCLLT